MHRTLALLLLLPCLFACAPEIGSPDWCQAMQEKPKGDWSLNETKDFARHCLL